jgi:hypothetical protein
MALGPGKYDEICTAARIAAGARGIVLIVIEGKRGHGFSLQAEEGWEKAIPGLLRKMADDIEKDQEE